MFLIVLLSTRNHHQPAHIDMDIETNPLSVQFFTFSKIDNHTFLQSLDNRPRTVPSSSAPRTIEKQNFKFCPFFVRHHLARHRLARRPVIASPVAPSSPRGSPVIASPVATSSPRGRPIVAVIVVVSLCDVLCSVCC